MTTSRLAKSEAPPKLAPQETCDMLNAYLRGEVTGVHGKFIEKRRSDVHWVVRYGKPEIEWRP
jgi:hypothetical protein